MKTGSSDFKSGRGLVAYRSEVEDSGPIANFKRVQPHQAEERSVASRGSKFVPFVVCYNLATCAL